MTESEAKELRKQLLEWLGAGVALFMWSPLMASLIAHLSESTLSAEEALFFAVYSLTTVGWAGHVRNNHNRRKKV